MALKAPQGNNDRVVQLPLEPDVYRGRLVQIIDMGLQAQREFKGEAKKPCQEIMLTYELVDEFMKDEEGNDVEDKPRWISETLPFYGLFADKAKSTQRYKACDPDEQFEGDFAKCIDTPLNVTVVQNKSGDKIYENVASVAAMSAKNAAKMPELKNPAKVFDLDNPDMEIFNKLPKWVKEKIQANLNYRGSALEKAIGGAPIEKKEEAKVEEKKNNNPY